jgi:DedD protein
MDTRFKERLTGAIVLVAIVVILVPELLKGPREPKAPLNPVPASTIDVSGDARGRMAPATPAPPAPAPEATSQAAAAIGATVPAAPAAAPASAPPASTPAVAPPVAAPTSWVVQLGSFGLRENAQKLVKELHNKGYAAFLAEYRGSGATLYRVRVGPEQDRARADALASRLAREGYKRSSVAEQP